MQSAQYILLYHDGRRVRAADTTHLVTTEYPSALRVGERQYGRIDDEDPFIFWDELRDSADRTVGYTFLLPESASFRSARLWTHSENVELANKEVRLLLQDCESPKWECIQAFNSDLYQSVADPMDCMLLMVDWSENPKAYPLNSSIATLVQRWG